MAEWEIPNAQEHMRNSENTEYQQELHRYSELDSLRIRILLNQNHKMRILLSAWLTASAYAAAETTLLIDPESWLSFAFPLGQRICPTTGIKCSSQVFGVERTPARDVAVAETVYLTSFGGRPNPVRLPDSTDMFKVAVFMENDARLYPGGAAGLESVLEASFFPQLDLALGFAPQSPVPNSHVPWERLSYIDDPESMFSNPPVPWENKISGVAFFSSQCSPLFAQPRLELVERFTQAFQGRFASFGACHHTESLAETVPECVGLPVWNVDHDGEKHCALSHFPFYLAIENSEAPGYATEKLWQGLIAGSVPIYWGESNVLELLPHPDAVVDVRAFNNSIDNLAAYIHQALNDGGEIYRKHTAWKKMPLHEWSPHFLDLLSRPKSGVFCRVCEWAAAAAETKQRQRTEEEEEEEEEEKDEEEEEEEREIEVNRAVFLSEQEHQLRKEKEVGEGASLLLADLCTATKDIDSLPGKETTLQAASSSVVLPLEPLIGLLSVSISSAKRKSLLANEFQISWPLLKSTLFRDKTSGGLAQSCMRLLECPPFGSSSSSRGVGDGGGGGGEDESQCDVSAVLPWMETSWALLIKTMEDTDPSCADEARSDAFSSENSTSEHLVAAAAETGLGKNFIFEGADSRHGGMFRLPCEFEGVITIPAHLSHDASHIPVDVEVPLGEGLSKIQSFEKLHHHFLMKDFTNVCEHFHGLQKEADGACIGRLYRDLDLEILNVCPSRLSTPAAAAAAAATRTWSLSSLETANEVHIAVDNDSDMQRFYHFMMAEILPVVSVVLRMVHGQPRDDDGHPPPASEETRKKKAVYLHSASRNWGSNPLHDFFAEIASLDGRVDIHLVNHEMMSAESWLSTVGGNNMIQLPRWDFGWFGQDKDLALEAGRHLKEIAHKKLYPTSSSSSSSRDATTTTERQRRRSNKSGFVFQLRKPDPRLAQYYKTFYEQLLNSGFSKEEFGNQDYSAYGAERRHVRGMDKLAQQTAQEFPLTNVEVVEGDDGLSLVPQMARYLDAFGLVLGHGAGMVHALWLKPNATVIEVGPTADLANNYLDRITQVFGLRYRRVVCESHEDVSSTEPLSICGELRQAIREVIHEEEERRRRKEEGIAKVASS
jgi:hypothetical protein